LAKLVEEIAGSPDSRPGVIAVASIAACQRARRAAIRQSRRTVDSEIPRNLRDFDVFQAAEIAKLYHLGLSGIEPGKLVESSVENNEVDGADLVGRPDRGSPRRVHDRHGGRACRHLGREQSQSEFGA